MAVSFSKLSSYLGMAVAAYCICASPALAHNITFNTDFANPDAGPGTILDQSAISAARIFQYTEDDIYATAIRDTDPESHFHLYGVVFLTSLRPLTHLPLVDKHASSSQI